MGKDAVKIILVATDAKGRNLVFVTDTLRVYSLDEAIPLAKAGKFTDVYAVSRNGNTYLRTKPNTTKKEQLDQITISSYPLFSSLDNIERALSTPAFVEYLQRHQDRLQQKIYRKQQYVFVKRYPKVANQELKTILQSNEDHIFEAAKRFSVDPYLLGAIIIDEFIRANPIEAITDRLLLYSIGKNTSAGIAQVKIETARGLIKHGYYTPDPAKFPPANIHTISRRKLYQEVKKSKHSIHFAAARMRESADRWKKFVDLSKRPEILASLYSMRKAPHLHPEPNERGLQIANEFYRLAKAWLR